MGASNNVYLNTMMIPPSSLEEEKTYVDELVKLLGAFSAVLGMKTNWHKSSAYWFDRHIPKPNWLDFYNWTWATEYDLSKLFGTPFGLNLHTEDVNQFFFKKMPIFFILLEHNKT